MKTGLIVMDKDELEVLTVALDHMWEHLNDLLNDNTYDAEETAYMKLRMAACERLIDSIK